MRLKIASWILIGLLLLPMLQHATRLVHERNLKGAVTQAPIPILTGDRWMEGTYQDSLEQALNDRFGFRNTFIRINNQVAFSLYQKALANGVIVGKNNYLYEIGYIRAQNGENYLGDSLIAAKATKLKEVQDYFTARGKHFVVTFAAGKGSFYPEYIPDRFNKQPTREQAESNRGNNLGEYARQFDSLGVNYINFNQWFLEMKDTSRYCLFPRTGTHWSYYGIVLVMDSLQSYLSTKTGLAIPQITYDEIELSKDYKGSDRDIELSMNILFRVNNDLMAYPKMKIIEEDMEKPKGVVIADSFYWGLHNLGFSSRVLDMGEFWFYNRKVYSRSVNGSAALDTMDRMDRLENMDVIILMATEATLPKFPFGFENILE